MTTVGTLTIAVAAASLADQDAAADLASALSLTLLPGLPDPAAETSFDALLMIAGQRLMLQATGKRAPGPVAVDFASAGLRHRRQSGHNELLGKAVGVGKKVPLRVLDATAGLGRDAYVLADLGCDVLLCERHPIVAALLASGLQRALHSADLSLVETRSRMQLYAGEARDVAPDTLRSQDVIYLDPMFPARMKSAAVKKEMALFQQLLHAALDEGKGEIEREGEREGESEALLDWALQADVARVVVKRPLRAPVLAQREPGHSIRGKSVRYDVYARRKLA
tara:strand:- start:211618 stop:212460 length:843 start_codon:yes stop_codon:yes gene_type:complete